MLNCILRSTPDSKTVYIIDTRPRVSDEATFLSVSAKKVRLDWVRMPTLATEFTWLFFVASCYCNTSSR